MGLLLVTINRTGGNSTIALPKSVASKLRLKTGPISDRGRLAKRFHKAGEMGLAKFLETADWVCWIKTEEQHASDIVARYT
jgi:antitoxin component of MazEF toxin-antitoxin module